MPRNNGVYTLPPVYFAEDGEIIQPNQHNIPLQDVAQALTGSVPRDGTAAMTGDLPMNGRKVTGLGTATAPGDAVRLDQLPQGVTGWLSSVAALTMAADRIPYATGVSTAALAVFTAAGRAVVGAADAAAQRLALGLGALATKNKAAVTDIDVTGTPGANAALFGDRWAPMFGSVRAWGRFSGSGSISGLVSGNVASVTRSAVGHYSVTFSTAMPSASYSVIASRTSGDTSRSWVYFANVSSVSTTGFTIQTGYVSGTSAGNYNDFQDSSAVSFIVVS